LTKSKDINFSEDAQRIIELVKKSRKNLFITGKAGTGKSTLLHHISEIDPDIVVLAPTGIAAINVNGETIHSFFKLKPGYELDEAKHVRISNKMISDYEDLKTVIIDEISMVRADILDAIDIFLQRVKKNNSPFGGVRMIFFGDLFQLPPVLRNEDKEQFYQTYKSPYFFSAQVFIQHDLFVDPFQLEQCELNHIYRQKDPVFTDILNSIRNNKATATQLNLLNKQVGSGSQNSEDFQIKLVSTNALANKFNSERLEKLNHKEHRFDAHARGNVENLRPNEKNVFLKKEAQVMFINNDPQKRWVNGTIGKILSFGEKLDPESEELYKYVEVELENGKTIEVAPFTWEISKYVFKSGKFQREQIGTFTQIPLKLAWAITIHKSQGKTFNKVEINLGRGSFAHGQTYVALSRCTSLENITLAAPIRQSDIILDEEVLRFSNS